MCPNTNRKCNKLHVKFDHHEKIKVIIYLHLIHLNICINNHTDRFYSVVFILKIKVI